MFLLFHPLCLILAMTDTLSSILFDSYVAKCCCLIMYLKVTFINGYSF